MTDFYLFYAAQEEEEAGMEEFLNWCRNITDLHEECRQNRQ